MQQNEAGTDNSQQGAIAHERVSSPGQGVGGQDAPRQAGHKQELGAFGDENKNRNEPEGQVQHGQDQMSAGLTVEQSQTTGGS